MAFPTASPTGFAWLAELAPFPTIDLGDEAEISVVAKCGGIILVSNELAADSSTNLTNQLGVMLKDSLSRELDLGLLLGAGPPAPDGIVAKAPVADGADLLGAALAAIGSIADAGGSADTIALSGAAWAAEAGRTSTDGTLIHPGSSLVDVAGLKPVLVPALASSLVYDHSRVFLVLGEDSTAEVSTDFAFDRDAAAVRVKARVNVAAPTADKAIRKLTITAPGTTKASSSKS
jgi:hypothetical protein